MNYDHRFHAGNFADVFKHIVLTRILLYLQRKPAPFRVIDTHAGCGSYDLDGDAANRTLEWKGGIGRLDPEALSADARDLVRPYLDVVSATRLGLARYPGSPLLALRLTRRCDRMIFCELHPTALVGLRACVARDQRTRVVGLDGYVALNAYTPPVERRGLVLIDPPFEDDDEFERLAAALVAAHAKWRDGIYMAWYPVKDRRGAERLTSKVSQAGIDDVLRLEFAVDRPQTGHALVSNGLIVINPPYTLQAEMACVLPELQRQLGSERARWQIDRLAAG